jgi:putative cell wall-binding protein
MHRAVLLTLAVTAALVAPAPPAGAGPRVASGRVVPAAADYATEAFSDPWDYANAEDILLDAPGPSQFVTGQRVEGGQLRFDADRGAHVSPLWVGFPEALPERRSGPLHPVDASRYTAASVHAYASERTPAALLWFGCRAFEDRCLGGRRFTLEAGWHTYTFRLENELPGLSQPWSGQLPGMRFAVSPGAAASFAVDWLRLHASGAGTTVTGDGGTIFWDADSDPANNTPDRAGWGPVGTGTSVTFPSDAYPPGTYRFYEQRGAYSEPLVIAAPPLPVIDDPDFTGGEDYASAVLGDPWDFEGPGDAEALGNVEAVSFTGGQLHATNGPPQRNDPFVRLRLGAGGLDAARYHRLTVTMTYEGGFSLEDVPGGGTHGRLLWWRRDTGDAFHNSREIVTWTDRATYSVDLATEPPAEVEAPEDGHRVGWTGGTMTLLRWDPNEDPGARRWHLDEVRLAADDEARGAFDVRWHDNRPGDAGDVRVSLYYDTDRSGFDGTVIAADLAQQPGLNSYRWQIGGLPGGRYWLYLVSSDGASTSRRYADGPLVVVPTDAPPPSHPEARLAGADRIATALALSGAAFPDRAPAVVVARAGDFPDALAAAPLATAAGGPLLLNPSDELDRRVRAEIERLGADTVYVMGGRAAQSPAVEASLQAISGVEVVRVSGANRYATAAEAARRAVALWRAAGDGRAGERVLVALGTTFPDALAAGPLAAAGHLPLLLVAPDAVPADTRGAADAFDADEVVVVGGSAAVPDEVARDVAPEAAVARVAGRSRYETAALAAQAAVDEGADGDVVLVAAGHTFPDALGAGPAAAALGGVLLLTDRDTLPEGTRAWVAARRDTLAFLKVAGGRAAVSDAVVDALLRAAARA